MAATVLLGAALIISSESQSRGFMLTAIAAGMTYADHGEVELPATQLLAWTYAQKGEDDLADQQLVTGQDLA